MVHRNLIEVVRGGGRVFVNHSYVFRPLVECIITEGMKATSLLINILPRIMNGFHLHGLTEGVGALLKAAMLQSRPCTLHELRCLFLGCFKERKAFGFS